MLTSRYIRLLVLLAISVFFAGCASAPSIQNSTPNTELTEVKTIPVQKESPITRIALLENTKTQEQPIQLAPKLDDTPENFWSELNDNFALPEVQHKSIDREFNKLLKHPKMLRRNIQAALPLLAYVENEIDKKGLPAELALIPFIESNYQIEAKSSSNAKGPWQIIPRTATSLGLETSSWQDDSYNLALSTQAALNYFNAHHERFDDWILAIAAYNAGAARVARSVKRSTYSTQSPEKFFDLVLPKETRNYIPKLLAYKKLFSEHESYPEIFPNQFAYTKLSLLTVNKQISFDVLASVLDLDKELFSQFNVGYPRWTTPPNAQAVLVIPQEIAKNATIKLDSLSSNERIPWIEYKIQKGDSLSKIAHQHHSSVAEIKLLNNLKSSRIVAGKAIRIPHDPSTQ